MSPTRHYFHRATEAKALPPKPPKPQRPVHKGKVVSVLIDGQLRIMSSKEAALRIGRSKGGRNAQATGKAHRWTSEEAKRAIRKCWNTRWRALKGTGLTKPGTRPIRIGRPAKLRPPVRRQPLRDKYASPPQTGIHFWSGAWWHGSQRIGERTALRKLGYLPYPRKNPVPDKIVGTGLVHQKHRRTDP